MAIVGAGTEEAGGPPPADDGRLARGVLNDWDIAALTLADMAPAMSFYFSFATIVATAGIASPLTVIAGMIAIALLGNTISQFSRSRPSTGSFVTFIGSAFGGYSAVVTAVVLCVGYIIAVAAVVVISGGLLETILQHYLSITVPWQASSAALSIGAFALIVSGAKPSTRVAAGLFVFQVALLMVVAIALLIEHSGHINLSPFDPSHLHRGFSGLSLGFPLAIYLFVGWENSAALAEEHRDPRRGVTRAVFSSIAVVGVLYVFSPTRRWSASTTTRGADRRLGSVPHGGRGGCQRTVVRRLPGGLYLDLLLPDRGHQLAGENHLQLRP